MGQREKMKVAAIAAAGILAMGPAAAQDSEWTFQGSLYAWIPGISTAVESRFGTIESEASGSNALDSLEAAFMGTFEARRGRLSLIGDLLYTKLGSDQPSPFGRRFKEASVETEVSAFTGYALYRTYESEHVLLDLGGGFRAFGLNIDTTLESADSRPDESNDLSTSWVVPVVAGRVILPFTEHWFATALVDGGSYNDSQTWQAFASVGYRFNQNWSAQAGYRYMNIEKTISGQEVTVDLDGPLLGFSYHF
jgi:hypothetical protein